jgi:hypothetical protein
MLERLRDQPHLVILGAGASRAACPTGDRHGNALPMMNDLAMFLPSVSKIIEKYGLADQADDIELLFTRLYSQKSPICEELELEIKRYFQLLQLPDSPTIYDYLVMSLREKDIIATFNWDPLLVQALCRNSKYAKSPSVLFLHGNVGVGHCLDHEPATHAPLGRRCRVCGQALAASRLLYPVADKDYTSDPFIRLQWDILDKTLKSPFLITIFGYGAPETDVAAVERMRLNRGDLSNRFLDQFEIIDIKNEEELRDKWDAFIFSDHYAIVPDFFESYLAKHPRRSCESLWGQLVQGNWDIEPRRLSLAENWDEFENVFMPLLDEENLKSDSANNA